MALKEFALPDVGEGVAEGELVTWLVEAGERVEEDQPIAEVETDKAMVEIPSAYDGVVSELRAEEGEMVPVGEVFVVFETDEDDAAGDDTATAGAADEGSAGAVGGDPTDDAAVPDGRVFAPPRVRRLARAEGVDLGNVAGSGPGGRITEADVEAAAGAGSGAAADDGSRESPGDGTVTAGASTNGTSESIQSGAAGRSRADRDRTLAMPATRQLAREEGVDLDAVPASEERDGEAFVTPADVRSYADAGREATPEGATLPTASAPESSASAGTESTVDGETAPETDAEATPGTDVEATTAAEESGPRPGDRVPYTGIRRTIGDRMAESKYTAPHVSHHDEVDVTDLVETRTRLKEVADDSGVTLTYLPFVIKAVIAGLRAEPYMNSQLDEEAEEIVLHDEYHIGIAVATDAGLMVPVVENADRKGLLEIAREVQDLAKRARDRTISVDELRGSTFTITNLGAVGGEHASPIINYPEAGILALGEIKEKPAVHEGEVVPREILTISASVDHRIVDGAIAARFTNKVKQYLHDPDLLLLE
ncbi:2-oxo acid dehydrogenase subunit E2 [Halobellus ruber]|uniref:2-oxo acid dehydrogenase subunit E2 n=1 Tax=Halobellus ruber TaxID=2761102 RepID=A0A7J9SMB5_9EURY|nr:2-oxo acid dehydrogenase subunit E2 [Halobellus ruber]MBB6646181.1 2-oxo acid dehydrogenase subunit E2 [Halobellus ruber]